MADQQQPEVKIKFVKKKGGHAAAHGAAWKGAYADLVTAMMAFFLLMWLLRSANANTKAGIAGMFPPLAGSEWVLGDERVLVQVPLHGIQGDLDVKGQTYKGTMPAFASLSDDEIAAVLSHVRSQWGNTAPSVTAAVVAAGRAKNASRVGPWSSGDEIRRGAVP